MTGEMTFARFLREYRRNNQIGDLAAEFRGDSNAPQTDAELITYLRDRAYDSEVKAIIERAWAAYQRAVRR
jgi:hypothetical protein